MRLSLLMRTVDSLVESLAKRCTSPGRFSGVGVGIGIDIDPVVLRVSPKSRLIRAVRYRIPIPTPISAG